MKKALVLLWFLLLSLPASAANSVELVKNLFRSGENPSGSLTLADDGKFYGTTQNGGAHGNGSIFRFDPELGTVVTIASFGSSIGRNPNGELLDPKDGFLYGTARRGGSLENGTVFRVNVSTGALTKLAQFDGVNSGKFPLGGLVKVANRYYGVASEGGASNCGTVFKVTPIAGSTTWDIGAFAAFTGADGKKPWGTLVESGTTTLFGTTELGGDNDLGVIFKIPTAGKNAGEIAEVRSFSGGADGANPRAGLWKSKVNGALYGTTLAGGTNGLGAVFRVNAAGADFSVIASMDSGTGTKPQGALVEPLVADGFLYGTCSEGGANGAGTVFKLSRDNNGAPLNADNVASFNTDDGKTPLAGLAFGRDGLAFGTTLSGGVGGLGSIFRVTPDNLLSESLSSPASFFSTEGSNPRAALVAGNDGFLYGSSFDGGASGDGAIFSVGPDGSFGIVASFTGPDGSNPLSPVVISDDGTLYGTTYRGGSGRGTFFRITADGTVQALVKFAGANTPPGSNPRGALVRRGQEFFGVTEKGGTNDRGTIFKVTVNGIGSTTPATHSTLHHFSSTTGEFPFGGLVDGGDGFFYGTTTKGGANQFGTFFKVDSNGNFTKLYDFTNANPTPAGTLVKDSGGANFFGTSDPSLYEVSQGQGPGFGTVFKISAAGSLTTLHTFSGALPEDGGPRGIVQISSTQLVGVTYRDGGTLFTLATTPGTPTTQYRFDDDFTGELPASRPEASPIIGSDGAVYGVTQKSSNGGGSVFRFLSNPSASITSVTETSADGAIARGIVNPNGSTVSVFFQYSLTEDFAVSASTPPLEFTGENALPVSGDLVNLTPGATYYVRLVAGTRKSRTFVYGRPVATSGAAVGIGASVATVRSLVNPSGRETTAVLEYGTSETYGMTVPLGSIGNGSEGVIVEAALTGLIPQTTYHYRISATNAAGTSTGLNAKFSTGQNSPPTAPPLLGLSVSRTAAISIEVPDDLDPDNEAITLDVEVQPAFGTASVVNNTTLRFVPNARFKGQDSFTYSVTDPSMVKTTGIVTIRNPFTALKGSYVTTISSAQGEPIGSVSLTVAANGAFTGTVKYGRSISVKGTFDASTGERQGAATISIPRKGKTPLLIVLRMDTRALAGALSGTVDNFDIVDDARLLTTKNAVEAGRYTMWLRAPAEPEFPRGQGWATLSISKTGRCVIAGKLGDGTAFSSAPRIRVTGSILLDVPLFATQPVAGRGRLYGRLQFQNKPGSDADGALTWKRGPQPKSVYFPDGFGPVELTVIASRWAPIQTLPGVHFLNLTGGEIPQTNNFPIGLSLGIANVSSGISKATIETLNEPEKVVLSANFKTGIFSGTFIHPEVGPKKPRAFSGILFQKQNVGVGVFSGITTTGDVKLDLQ